MLYHYTSKAALNGIINDLGVTLWATKYSHLNDLDEMKWCQEDLSLLCQNSFGSPQEDFRLYKKYPYTISFCQKNDDLYMWKNYGDAGKGFMLSFNRNVILDHSYKSPQSILLPVSYASSDNKEKIFEDKFMEFQNIFETTNDPFDDVISTCAFVKKDNYVRESEYRYAVLKETNMSFQDGIIKTAEDLSEVKYRTRGNEEILKIPYLDVTFSPEALVEIIIGFDLPFNETKEELRRFLEKFGDKFNHVNILPSNCQTE